MLPTFLSSLPIAHTHILFSPLLLTLSLHTLRLCNDTVAISVVTMNSAISPNPSLSGDRIVRHPEYYIHGGDVIFRVRGPHHRLSFFRL